MTGLRLLEIIVPNNFQVSYLARVHPRLSVRAHVHPIPEVQGAAAAVHGCS